MASVGRKSLTLQNSDLTKLPDLYKMVLSGLKLEGVDSEVLLLFAERLDIKDCGCWHWSGERDAKSYPKFWPGAKWASSANSLAHRFSSAIFTGKLVPKGMVVDHLCADRGCVAPHHLKVITFKKNVQLGFTRSHAKAVCSPDYCPKPKPLTSTASPKGDYATETINNFVKFKNMLISTAEVEDRKLFAFAAHVNLKGGKPLADRGAVGECWAWEGAVTDGYAKLTWKQVKGVTRSAHRWSYLNFVGNIEKGMHIDHMCERRNCVRPSHLQQLTSIENTALAINNVSAINRLKTHCKNGHEFTPENTRVKETETTRKRVCITCSRAAGRAYKRKGPNEVKKLVGKQATECKNGHAYTEENTRITSDGTRKCRRCVADAATARRNKRKAAGTYAEHPRRIKPSEDETSEDS